jgi:thymidylate kinase
VKAGDRNIRVIVIEGHSGTGKTTVGGQLCIELRRRGLNVAYIPEHGYYLNPLLGQWVRHHADIDDRRRTGDFIWLDIERQRMAFLARAHARGANAAIVDTSLLSVVAYELAKCRLDPWALDKTLLMAIVSYLEKADERPAVLWAFLHASSETIIDRLIARGGARGVLASPEAIATLNDFRRYFSNTWLKKHAYADWNSPVNPQALADWVLNPYASAAQEDRMALLSAAHALLEIVIN